MFLGLGYPCRHRNPTLRGPTLQGGLRLADARHYMALFPSSETLSYFYPSWIREDKIEWGCWP